MERMRQIKRSILISAVVTLSFIGNANADTWTTLDYPGATGGTFPYGVCVNNVIGTYYVSGSDKSHGFLYDGTSWTTLDYPGANGTWAYGISGNSIVGFYTEGSYHQHGFLYDGTSWVTIDYPGATYTAVH
jgi:hypothetical protein